MGKRISPHRSIHDDAFTLVELLVVITIIVILAAMLFPAVQSMRAKGMRTKTEEILKKVDSAIRLYSNDMGHYPYVRGAWLDGDQTNAWAIHENNCRLLKDSVGTTANTMRYLARGDLAVTDTQEFYIDSWGKSLVYVYVYPTASYATLTPGGYVIDRSKLSANNNYGRPYAGAIGSGKNDAPTPKQGYLFEFELWSAGQDKCFTNLRGRACTITGHSGCERDNVTVTPWE